MKNIAAAQTHLHSFINIVSNINFSPISNMKFSLVTVTAIIGTVAAMAIGERDEQDGTLEARGCRFIDKQDCNDRYWACQQDSIPSAINWYVIFPSIQPLICDALGGYRYLHT